MHPFEGRLIGIFVAPDKGLELSAVDQARAVPGRGLEGDRYFLAQGTYSKKGPRPDQEVSLIESEALAALAAEGGPRLEPAKSRRNLLTAGVPLNHLVGRHFLVGEVRLEGLRLCEPCGHMEKLSSPGAREGLLHRGGLRARILSEGLLRPGDAIRPVQE